MPPGSDAAREAGSVQPLAAIRRLLPHRTCSTGTLCGLPAQQGSLAGGHHIRRPYARRGLPLPGLQLRHLFSQDRRVVDELAHENRAHGRCSGDGGMEAQTGRRPPRASFRQSKYGRVRTGGLTHTPIGSVPFPGTVGCPQHPACVRRRLRDLIGACRGSRDCPVRRPRQRTARMGH